MRTVSFVGREVLDSARQSAWRAINAAYHDQIAFAIPVSQHRPVNPVQRSRHMVYPAPLSIPLIGPQRNTEKPGRTFKLVN